MSNLGYQIGRVFGTPYFKKHYNLKIINKEFIPKEGPILLCGNHLHVLDQFPVIASTSRTSHWMAKKEYFDGKLGPLFKMTGAISVDRFGDAKKAEIEAIDYLNQGSAVGLFPEGTRNGLKEEKLQELYELYSSDISYDDFKKLMPKNTLASQINLLDKLYKEEKITRNEYKSYILSAKNAVHELCEMERITPSECEDSILLPFKYGAVSMASKTNAKIVPFGVTGHYVKNSNDLTVSFAKPLDVNNYNSLEEANLALRENVKSLVKQNINSSIK
ncbi:protein containing Phospholipid/glycerol acyltransferase domain protein [human gut metagenome]|uniref:Protein containing Phospholipid/glycerol acyltransferase domain protein n=1 Tax=human gut metagenome TaxID=408170 RepID=K1S488_9ZZZZ